MKRYNNNTIRRAQSADVKRGQHHDFRKVSKHIFLP